MDVLLFYPSLLIPTLYKPHTSKQRQRQEFLCVHSESEFQPKNFESDLAVLFLGPDGGTASCAWAQGKHSLYMSDRLMELLDKAAALLLQSVQTWLSVWQFPSLNPLTSCMNCCVTQWVYIQTGMFLSLS